MKDLLGSDHRCLHLHSQRWSRHLWSRLRPKSRAPIWHIWSGLCHSLLWKLASRCPWMERLDPNPNWGKEKITKLCVNYQTKRLFRAFFANTVNKFLIDKPIIFTSPITSLLGSKPHHIPTRVQACCIKWINNITKIRHLAKDEWETSDLIRFFIEMQNET